MFVFVNLEKVLKENLDNKNDGCASKKILLYATFKYNFKFRNFDALFYTIAPGICIVYVLMFTWIMQKILDCFF